MDKRTGRPLPQIIAFGGGGVADSWIDPRTFRYVLEATNVERPRVALLTSACGDDPRLVSRLHRIYQRLGAVTEQLETGKNTGSCSPEILSKHFDLVHVEGGNMAFLMERLIRSGMDRALHEAWINGVVLTGTSAGASCWFAQAMGASLFSFIESEQTIAVQAGLAFLPYSICVHYDVSSGRRQAYHASISAGLQSGFGLDQDAGLHFQGANLKRIICRQPGSGASEVSQQDKKVDENRLEGQSLGPLEWNLTLQRELHGLGQRLRRRFPKFQRPKDL